MRCPVSRGTWVCVIGKSKGFPSGIACGCPSDIFGLAGAALDVGEAGQVGVGLFFEAVGLSPAGWLSLVWNLSISRATAAGFGLAIAAGPLMVSRGSIRGAVEASEWAAAMRPQRQVETLLPKDGPGGGCRYVTRRDAGLAGSEIGGSDRVNGGLVAGPGWWRVAQERHDR